MADVKINGWTVQAYVHWDSGQQQKSSKQQEFHKYLAF